MRHRSVVRGRRPGPRAVRPVAVLLLAASLGVAGCSSGGDESAMSDSKAGGQAADRAPGSDAGAAAPGGQKEASPGDADKKPPKLTGAHIIRTASLRVRVKDVTDALEEARTAAEGAGGIVGDETTERDSDGNERSRIVLRVPQEGYDTVLEELAGTGTLLERRVKAEDVTDQVVDVESRVKSQRASVARVRELMDDATELTDVVSLEGELSTRQAELEALQAQQASLKDRTSMATITLSLSEKAVEKKPAEKEDEGPSFMDALSGGWSAFVSMLRWLAVVVGAVLPFAAGLALLFVLWRLVRARLPRRPGRPQQPPAAPPTEPSERD